ncbi:MAG: hypothetical protein OXB95_10560 [Rhodobacteraceae bacterium]|nr:hypothetical protein [Paracoccaceae bacterium]
MAEAELSSLGLSPSCVHWSGSINAPDVGVDVRVDAERLGDQKGFIPRPNTIFQVKKSAMSAGKIKKEMCPSGKLLSAIAEQARKSGSYTIVSLADDCSERMKRNRIGEMKAALKGTPFANQILLDFYDRSKLWQWLRQHQPVIIWTRSVVGQPLSGWEPYGRWSRPPADADDSLILEKGVTVILPSNPYQKLSIRNAIAPMRKLIWPSRKAIRIFGLSGVGKTRIVQALFEENVGEEPLDRTSAIYVDLGDEPTPSANVMLERLLAENRTAILVLDNCPSELHVTLAQRIASEGTNVRLITIEYDIRDDKPQTTEVIQVIADGPTIAEKLVLRRFPGIGTSNARRLAEFADGNCRIALAVAEGVESGESLASLSDATLFDRLFIQRKGEDGELRQHARLLALVYSFSVDSSNQGCDELAVLGSLCEVSGKQLYSSVAELMNRQVAQERSDWRAILPQAIANRLAREALKHIRIELLRSTFEADGRGRLLTSFGHRLGLMHDNRDAQKIVRSWLSDEGPLGSILTLNKQGLKLLAFAAPAAPDAVLDRLANDIDSADFAGLPPTFSFASLLPMHSPDKTIVNLLCALAYERDTFDCCARLLLRVADYEYDAIDNAGVEGRLVKFFQLYLSGTHASLDQRLSLLRGVLDSGMVSRQKLGFQMLSTALGGPPWFSNGLNEFGAQPRDSGFEPSSEEVDEWYSQFIDVAVEYGMREDGDLAQQSRQTFADRFLDLWKMPSMRKKLVNAAERLHDQHPSWIEVGWVAVRKTIVCNYTKPASDQNEEPLPPELELLEKQLEPRDLIARIRVYVLGHNSWPRYLDKEYTCDQSNGYEASKARLEQNAKALGECFAHSRNSIAALGPRLFSKDPMPYRNSFGQGLAVGAPDKQAMWEDLVEHSHQSASENSDHSVLAGFVQQLDHDDRSHAQSVLNQCSNDSKLGRILIDLHPVESFGENDVGRCLKVLDLPEVSVKVVIGLFVRIQNASLPAQRFLDVARAVLEKPNGSDVVLEAIYVKLRGNSSDADVLGEEIRRIGLIAATRRVLCQDSAPHSLVQSHIERVLRASLRFGGNELEKSAWLDAVFNQMDDRSENLNSFRGAVIVTCGQMPHEFLDRVFTEDKVRRLKRTSFIGRKAQTKSIWICTEVDDLIKWCEHRNCPKAWNIIATGMKIRESTSKGRIFRIGEALVRFIEASPIPKDVLLTLTDRIQPISWKGSRAAVMESRKAEFEQLLQHQDPRIRSGAKVAVERCRMLVQNARKEEREEDRAREQRFE